MKLARLFQKNGVLQRDQEIPVWGCGEPGSRVVCELGGRRGEGVCGADGRFEVRLPGMKASEESLTLTVRNADTGERLDIGPVYVGEVFLCSGQSNMAFQLKDENHISDLKTSGELDNAGIHFFKVPHDPFTAEPGNLGESACWQVASAETSPAFSAVGFLFARQLSRAFPGVKIGIIEAAWGGTGIECWTSREALAENLFWKDRLAAYHAPGREDCDEMEGLRKLFPELPVYDSQSHDWHEAGCDDSAWETMELPDSWTVTGRNYAGIFWFRRDFELAAVPEKGMTLNLGMIDKADETYVNGKLVARTGDGLDMGPAFVRRVYEVPASALKTGRNVIAVRVLSAVSIVAAGGLTGPAEDMFVYAGKQRLPLTGTWRFREEENLGTRGEDSFAYCGLKSAHSMYILFDHLIAPLIPYGLRGVLWYQGECNAINQAGEYYDCLKTWWGDWLKRWGQKRLELTVIQLPGCQRKSLYQPHSQWALLRDAQQRFCRDFRIPLVVATDTGEEYNLHPTDKMTISRRAAAIAAAQIRGERPPQSATALKAIGLADGSIRVQLDCAGGRLETGGRADCALVLSDGSWQSATLEVEGVDALLVKTELRGGRRIVYNWSNFPIGTLRSANGLPVAPFDCVIDYE